jgi:hypothetical protein
LTKKKNLKNEKEVRGSKKAKIKKREKNKS